MTPEELLRPRYKVIADYPGNNMAVGKIIQFDWHLENQRIELCHYYNKYPHLFQPLQWWEERKPEDLPKYVRYYNIVSRIVDVEYDADGMMYQIEWDGKGHFHLDNQYQLKGFSFKEVEPATLEEYTTYIKSLKQQ